MRLVLDAGADASKDVGIMNPWGGLFFKGTLLSVTSNFLHDESVHGERLAREQLDKLGATYSLLMRVEAVPAVSWLWPRDASPVGGRGAFTTFATTGTALATMLPILRRRARRPRLLLAPMFRYVASPPSVLMFFSSK